ncbi:DUF7010 family protein [Enteractinococcus helveticum]|uniref:Uncharacterized protein n=1 Tax=Enteractinococcus helveticum TaxID=1837282 RepID=A0A1B7M176_9MICC|nr:hypothetical protein [Enteractinococcus helveticum]OAV62356.1 hypothetical protein A6F49_06480 [Enteractinococcus helveticum]
MTTALATSAEGLSHLRRDISQRTGRGLNAIVAGILLWTTFTILGTLITDTDILALVYVFGAGVLFPLSLLVAKPLRLDPFAKGNPLGVLAGLLGAAQILFVPLMIGATLAVPAMVPWFLAVLVGAHFLPFSWVYDSRAYIFAAVSIPIVVGLIAWLLPSTVALTVPASVAVLLILTAVLLRGENTQTS